MTNTTQDFQEMIPLYVTGQLDLAQRNAFEQQLETDPQLKSELAEYAMIKQSYSSLSDQLPSPNPDLFSKIMDNIQPEPLKDIPKSPFWERILDQVKPVLVAPKFAWSVAVVQMAVIFFLVVSMPLERRFQTLSTTGDPVKPLGQLNVVFQETAMEKNIRTLLTGLNATIIDGPSENGLYIVAVKNPLNKAHALTALGASGLVTFVKERL